MRRGCMRAKNKQDIVGVLFFYRSAEKHELLELFVWIGFEQACRPCDPQGGVGAMGCVGN